MNPKSATLAEVNASKICVLPWINLVAGPGPELAVCCEMPGSIPTKFFNVNSLSEVNKVDPKVLRIKSLMLSGQEPPECKNCFAREHQGGKSIRHYYNEKYFAFNDGFNFSESSTEFLELRLGNLCQLECVMCNPSRSEKLEKTFSQLNDSVPGDRSYKGFISIKSINSSWLDSDVLVEQIIDLCKSVKFIYFNGGEPLLVKMHDTILTELINRGYAKNIVIAYSTNGLLLNKRHLKLWSEFRRVNVTVSIDDIGERNRFIRYPANWEKTVECLDLMKNAGLSNINFNIWSTIGILNFYYVDELVGFFKTNYPMFKHQIRGIQDPSFLSPVNIPNAVKTAILNNLKRSITDPGIISELEFITSSQPNEKLFLEGVEYLRRIAGLRRQNIDEIFGEFLAIAGCKQ